MPEVPQGQMPWDIYWDMFEKDIKRSITRTKDKSHVSEENPEGWVYTKELRFSEKEAKAFLEDTRILWTRAQNGEISPMMLPSYPEFADYWTKYRKTAIQQFGTAVAKGELYKIGDRYFGAKDLIEVTDPKELKAYLSPGELTAFQKETFRRADIATAYAVTQEANRQERERQKTEATWAQARAEQQNLPYLQAQERRARQIQEGVTREQARQEILSQLRSPKDWIARWQLEHGLSNYPTPAPLQIKAQDAQWNISQAREQTNLAAQQMQSGVITPQQYEQSVQQYFGAVSEGAPWIAQQQQAAASGQGMLASAVNRPPSAPPVPSWLPAFAPGVGKGTQYGEITAVNVPTPSAQLWAKTPWSEREGLAGYTEWAGQSLEDLLSQMDMMRTGTPRRQAWLPARQRI